MKITIEEKDNTYEYEAVAICAAIVTADNAIQTDITSVLMGNVSENVLAHMRKSIKKITKEVKRARKTK